MKVKINNQTYNLRFGFGALKILGQRFGLEDYTAVTELIQEAFASFDKITFKQEDVLKGIIVSAAQFAKDKNADALEDLEIIDFMLNETETFKNIIQAVTDAFPKDVGKQTAAQKKTATQSQKKK